MTEKIDPKLSTLGTLDRLPPPRRAHTARVHAWLRSVPFLALAGYYLLFVLVVFLAAGRFDSVRQAFFTPAVLPALSQVDAAALLHGGAPARELSAQMQALGQAFNRSVQTLLVILGSLLLVVPVAWIYMQTKRLRYDPALVRSVIILPIVVAGITMVVKYSIALAFALAGIVAAVRFRNTLKDPRDAVYIFLVIGIGLASGVQALDVALVMSMLFNFTMLTLWRYNIGSIYGSMYGQTGILSMGDPALLVGQMPSVRRQVRLSLLEEAEDVESDGILLVHTEEVDLARNVLQEALSEMAREWRLVHIVPRQGDLYTLEYVVRLKKKVVAADLVGALDERWSSHLHAAEYLPFRRRESKRDDSAAARD
jgi:hypothetical protein